MVDVYKWPPVKTVGFSSRPSNPASVSYDHKMSSFWSYGAPQREMYTAKVGLIGPSMSSGGYLRMLLSVLYQKPPLVEIAPLPPLFYMHDKALQHLRGSREIQFYLDGRDIDSVPPLRKGSVILGTATTDQGFPALYCVGFPPNMLIVRPGEVVRRKVGGQSRVFKEEYSDENGHALIRLQDALASGEVIVGYRPKMVMEITNLQDVKLNFGLGSTTETFEMIERFTDDYDGEEFEVIDPWN